LVEQKKAQLVVIAHDVDPVEVCVHPPVYVIFQWFVKKSKKTLSGWPLSWLRFK
jgi:hypothetical protein